MIGAQGSVVVGVDATNLRRGGGRTHLIEFLRAARPEEQGIGKVIVWSAGETLDLLDDREWLVKEEPPAGNRGLLRRALWQRFALSRLARNCGCDLLFVPGGSYAGSFRPVVTMSQNMLPFEWRELRRYGVSLITLKLLLLRWAQSRAFRRADGVIFLTEYARRTIGKSLKGLRRMTAIVPHGIGANFCRTPREQLSYSKFSADRQCLLTYVSHIEPYKHQNAVIEATASLRKAGYPVQLALIGPMGNAERQFRDCLGRHDPGGDFIDYVGEIPHAQLAQKYFETDLFIYASSCENMPNILLEAMAAGLPIVCSRYGPMQELLGDGGLYFDPEDPNELASQVGRMMKDSELRALSAQMAYERAGAFSWERCADATFNFLAAVLEKHREKKS